MSPDIANRKARMQRGLSAAAEAVRRDDEVATPPTATYERRGLAERAGTAPVSPETAAKLERIVHHGNQRDKAIIERVMLEVGYETGAAGFTANDTRPYLRINKVWRVSRFLHSGMYSALCGAGLI